MFGCSRQVGVAGATEDPKVVVGGYEAEERSMGIRGTDGFSGQEVEQVCGGMKSLNPIVCREGCLKQQGADNVISGANNPLGFTVLRRGVWAGHQKLHAFGEEKGPHGRIIKLAPVVTLNIINCESKLSGDISKKVRQRGEHIRF